MRGIAAVAAAAAVGCGVFSGAGVPPSVDAADTVAHGSGRKPLPRPYEMRVAPQTVHPGDIFTLTWEVSAGADTGEVELDGRRFPIIRDQGVYTSVVGLDMDATPGPTQLAFRIGQFTGSRDIVATAREFGSESLTVKPSYTDLAKETLERVELESVRMKKLWATITLEKLWREAFLKPTSGALGSPFGLRRIFNGEPRDPHSGLDIKSPPGTPIKASNRGRAVLAGNLFFTGNTVVIDHGLGLYTLYAHLSRIDAEEGAMVERGDVVGLVGATGRVTGPHLHWGVKLAGTRVDPTTLPGLNLAR